jgi:hypothetical protein
MSEIGGYFELELRKGNEYHSNSICLNTGRNALEYILLNRNFSKIYLPYFICDCILEPLVKLGIKYEFYSINENFEPVFDYKLIKTEEGFLYPNYFGLKDQFINQLSKDCKNLIIDCSQAFYSKPVINIPTFYSCRKFFGVPDGAYLFLDEFRNIELEIDNSENRISHLVNRIEYGAEAGYLDFKKNEDSLKGQTIKHMSKLTRALLSNIDYEFVMKKRKENFAYYHDKLCNCNELNFSITQDTVPLVYPFKINLVKLKQRLIENKIFVASYWTNVLDWVKVNSIEYDLVKNIIYLPVDQRYDKEDIDIILSIILDECQKQY